MSGNGRLLIAVGLIAAMVVALVVLLLSDGGEVASADTSTTTLAVTTSTTMAPATTTTVPPATTVTTDPDARIAEVEQILTELYVGWYGAVYERNEAALAEVVAIQLLYDAAVDSMESVEFMAPPSEENVKVTVIEIVLDRSDCLVVERDLDLEETVIDAQPNTAVQVLWPQSKGGDDYRLARLWSSPADLWQDDCDLMDRTEIP